MEYGVQIVSLAVILTILIGYFQNDRMPLMSTKMFTGFLLLAFFNIIAEFSTLYTITHIETVPPLLNRFCHQLFIGSLDCMSFFLYLYVDIKTRIQRRYGLKQLVIRLLPVSVAFLMVLFGKLEYHIGEDGRYSYGPMAMTVYVSVAVYLSLVIIRLMQQNNRFTQKEKRNLFYGISVWAVIAVFQFFHPAVLISSLGVALMVQFVYISFENPREYLDFEMENTMNRYAFELMLAELTERKKKFYLVSIVLSNTKLLKNSLGYKEMPQIIKKFSSQLSDYTKETVYHSKDNIISVILKDEQQYDDLMKKELQNMEYQGANGIHIRLKYFVSVLECPLYADSVEEILEVLDFTSSEGKKNETEGILWVNDKTVERKNYLAAVERLVQKAIREDGLEVYYQPIFSSKKKKYVSAEALVRLKDKETLGFISPEIFIPIAEKCGLVRELGNIVFEKVCDFASKNKLWQYGVEYIEVNISGIQSVDEQLPETLTACMQKYGIQPRFINLEITETASVEAGDMLLENMNKLREVGCRFSMDDFGTGYSNFLKMVENKFELIKLDKSLIWPCFESEKRNDDTLVVLNACIDMIRNLGISIVAEGVETMEQMEMLCEKGVAYLQGYYFSKPMPENDYVEFLRVNNVVCE